MNPVYTAYLDLLEGLHSEIHKSIAGLPVEALDWSPGPEMNSLAVLIVHLSAAELGQRLDHSLEYARQALEKLPPEALGEPRPSQTGRGTHNAAWAVLHADETTPPCIRF